MSVIADRVLKALRAYLMDSGVVTVEPRLRDWSGTKAAREIVLDAEEPEEHEVLRGNFTIAGEVMLQMNGRDATDEARREELGALADALADGTAAAWMSDSAEDRGLSATEPLTVHDFRTGDGVWEREGKTVVGRVPWEAIAVGYEA